MSITPSARTPSSLSPRPSNLPSSCRTWAFKSFAINNLLPFGVFSTDLQTSQVLTNLYSGGVRCVIVISGNLCRGRQVTDILFDRSRSVHRSAVDSGSVREINLSISHPEFVCSGVHSPFALLDDALPTRLRLITSVFTVKVMLKTQKWAP